jgi:hypothetical protein
VRKIFSFDAETNGLWGEAFSISAVVYDPNGREKDRVISRISDDHVTNKWVIANVLPEMQSIPVTHKTYFTMLRDFSEFYMRNKQDADIVVHMGVPVEARVLIDMVRFGFIGEDDGPYPLCDVAGNLQQSGENPTSVDLYIKKHNIIIEGIDGGTHNPLYDAIAAAKAYRRLRMWD